MKIRILLTLAVLAAAFILPASSPAQTAPEPEAVEIAPDAPESEPVRREDRPEELEQDATAPDAQAERREEADDEELLPPLSVDEDERNAAAEKGGALGRTITLDAAITLNYLFEGSNDGFLIKYSFHIEGEANADTAIVKGDAEIRSQVQGVLAKWSSGECKLDVTIPKVPYELIYKKTAEDKVSVNMQFKGTILETWQSECSFAGATKKFTTTGNPEKWLGEALNKARPPLTSIAIKLDERDASSTTFTINKQILADPPLGTAEVEGTGVVTISSRP